MLPVAGFRLKLSGERHRSATLDASSEAEREANVAGSELLAGPGRKPLRGTGNGGTVPGANDGVTTQELLQFLHIFLFVFWLGPDVAAYIWSRKAAEAGAPPEMQSVSRQMMTRVEMISRASMSLMLTVGGLLSHYVGLEHPWWQMAGIVLLGPVWLLLILAGFFRDGTPFGARRRCGSKPHCAGW
jgi:hypothetical protein